MLKKKMLKNDAEEPEQEYNIYCDESCHLENDHQPAMVLGALWLPRTVAAEISNELTDIKSKHGFSRKFEIKWIKISPSAAAFYEDLIKYFFSRRGLFFRALIVPNKSLLDHKFFKQDHDTWYYKMYFTMLKQLINPPLRYRIYLDYKDTRGGQKAAKLHETLCNNIHDFGRGIIERVQIIHSYESNIMQLADLLIGAVSSASRPGVTHSEAKRNIVRMVQALSKFNITASTFLTEKKFNLYRWDAAKGDK